MKRHQLTKACRQLQNAKGVEKSYQELLIDNAFLQEYKTKNDELQIRNHQLELELMKYKTENEIYKTLYGKLESQADEDNKENKKMVLALASKPTITTNTNNTQNNFTLLTPIDLTEKKINDAISEYQYDDYMKGLPGFTAWFIENLSKDQSGKFMLHCDDKNRYHLSWKGEDGSKVIDIKGKKLLEILNPKVEPTIAEYKTKRNKEIMEQYGDEDENYQGNENLISRKQRENRELAKVCSFDFIKQLITKLR